MGYIETSDLRGHCHRSCDGVAVLAQLANRADCQHVTG